jgi:hypothetical protein
MSILLNSEGLKNLGYDVFYIVSNTVYEAQEVCGQARASFGTRKECLAFIAGLITARDGYIHGNIYTERKHGMMHGRTGKIVEVISLD